MEGRGGGREGEEGLPCPGESLTSADVDVFAAHDAVAVGSNASVDRGVDVLSVVARFEGREDKGPVGAEMTEPRDLRDPEAVPDCDPPDPGLGVTESRAGNQGPRRVVEVYARGWLQKEAGHLAPAPAGLTPLPDNHFWLLMGGRY